MQCPKCNRAISGPVNFCPVCGTELSITAVSRGETAPAPGVAEAGGVGRDYVHGVQVKDGGRVGHINVQHTHVDLGIGNAVGAAVTSVAQTIDSVLPGKIARDLKRELETLGRDSDSLSSSFSKHLPRIVAANEQVSIRTLRQQICNAALERLHLIAARDPRLRPMVDGMQHRYSLAVAEIAKQDAKHKKQAIYCAIVFLFILILGAIIRNSSGTDKPADSPSAIPKSPNLDN